MFEPYLRKPSLPEGHKNSLLHISLKNFKFSFPNVGLYIKFIFIITQGRSLIFQDKEPIDPSPFSEYVITSLPQSTHNFPFNCGVLSVSSTLTNLSTCVCYHLECYN